MGTYKRKGREERLQEIQMAALELFLSKGYNNTTMEDIIHETTLSKGGFYNYYKSKDAILADLVRLKNYNYLQQVIDLSQCETVEDVCKALADAFVYRMTDPTPQSKLHFMMASEWAAGNDAFHDIYDAVEKEPLEYIVNAIKTVLPEFDEEKASSRLMLLYRINNTLHFLKKLQYRDKRDWGIDTDLLYNLYYHMFEDIVTDGISGSCASNGNMGRSS